MNSKSTVTLNSGNKMPIIGIGTWDLTRQTARTVAEALQLGFRMVDTSGDYGTQPGAGSGIRVSGIPRDQVYLVTKVEEDEDAYSSTRRSLEELKMTYADLMLIHRPPKKGYGKDLWKGLIRAREEGFVKDIGVSNYSIEQIESLIESTGEIPAVNQIEWSPFGHSTEILEYCRDNGIVVQAYSPLTHGQRLKDPNLKAIADHYGKTPSQILLRWNIELGVVPIVKASNPEHLAENVDIFDFELDNEDVELLMKFNEGYSALGGGSSHPAYSM